MNQGQFCKLISLEANSRICLIVENAKLHKAGSKPREQMVDQTRGISLANILKLYHLTAKMKVALAYILAHAAWQYYDSDWMNTKWTSDLIQFMKEHHIVGEQSNLFAWKPYLSVHANQSETTYHETSILEGEIHPFPRIQALGIILLEIGIGSPLYKSIDAHSEQSLAAKANEDWLRAMEYSKNEKLWEDCDYPSYRNAVNNCLDLKTFPAHPDNAEGLRQRRNTLYNKVVFPLEELLRGTKWMNKWAEIGPLSRPAKTSVNLSLLRPLAEPSTEETFLRKAAKKSLLKSQKDAKNWLSRIEWLNGELADLPMESVNSPPPVRIAVLDTGCDDGSLFFFDPDNASRLREWKDWTEESDEYQDCDGHGTHLTSLVMKLSPGAHIYVARVARNPDELLNSSENVAKVCILLYKTTTQKSILIYADWFVGDFLGKQKMEGRHYSHVLWI